MGVLDPNSPVGKHKCRAADHSPGFACYRRIHILLRPMVGEEMMMKRRDFLMIAAAGSLLPRTIARGQGAWPQRNITIVVPFLAGGSADLVARLFAQHFQAKYQVPVVVENKSGAGGSIGAGIVAKAAPDGYT